jgi:acyl-[acyl carrier protein]--UDP-N-acetylglucosamine O-acyltransferase
MAIGWGKSYEEQMEEASQRASAERIPRVAIEERLRLQRLESVKLSRSRIEDQLSKAIRPAHRQMLMKALQAIEEEAEEIAHTASEEKNEPQP